MLSRKKFKHFAHRVFRGAMYAVGLVALSVAVAVALVSCTDNAQGATTADCWNSPVVPYNVLLVRTLRPSTQPLTVTVVAKLKRVWDGCNKQPILTITIVHNGKATTAKSTSVPLPAAGRWIRYPVQVRYGSVFGTTCFEATVDVPGWGFISWPQSGQKPFCITVR